MKISKKLFSLLLSIVMLLGMFTVGVAASAATPTSKTIQAYPGQTVTIELSEQPCYGISGDISYSNRELFSSVTPGTSPYGQIREKKFILSSAEPNECKVTISVKVSATAAVGSKCTVTFEYLRVDDPVTLDGPDGLVKTVTVEVIEKEEESSSSTPIIPDKDSSSSPGSSPTTPVVPGTPSDPGTPSNVDLTELNKQIAIAQGLKEDDYTADSWKSLENALNAAYNARKSGNQATVNTAAKNLKNAIAALERVDGNSLQGLIDAVKSYLEGEDLTELREALVAALEAAEKALASGKQAAIDEATTALNAAFEAYKAKVNELGSGEIIEVEKLVEVLPSGDYCNVWLHTLWLIIMIVSLAVNAIFVVLTVRYFTRKKKNRTDDMPLVDYDINED